jgi:hypothetical protein
VFGKGLIFKHDDVTPIWNPGKSSLASGAPTLWYPGMSTSIPFNYCLLITDQLIVDQ